MAREVEALVLQVSADVRRMEKALNQVRGTTNRQLGLVEKRFDTMNARVRKSGEDMARGLGRSLAAVASALTVREVANYADAWTNATNRLSAAGVSITDLAAVQQRLLNISLQTRTGLTDTVVLYSRLTQATQGITRTSEDLARATEIVNQAFKAGGATISEQQAAITQLSQALSSGVLQGDELRSLRENAPLLARAIANEFGVTIGGLKKLGEEGKLTTDRIFSGILKAGQAIQTQFAATSITIGESFGNLVTSLTAAVGRLNDA
ncbi:MAG: tape measure protein, partial [Alsobacter sp.]